MILSNIKDFFLVLKMQNRQAWYHKKAAIGMILTWSVRIALTVALYTGIYNIIGKSSVHSISLPIAISSMFIYAILVGFGGRDIYRIITSEYKSGAMEIWLNKPISYLILKAAENLGKNIPIAVGLTACTAFYWVINGLPDVDFTLMRFAFGTMLLFFGLIIITLLYILVGLAVVWLQDSAPLFQIVDKTIMVFGGIYIPISFFPPVFRLIGETLPTGAVLFTSQMFYADFFQNLPRFLITQIFWIVFLLIAVNKANQVAQQHLTVNGG